MGLVRLYGSMGGGFVSLLFAVLTVVLGQLWFVLAACGCCQFARPAVRHRWERASQALLFAFGAVGLTAFAICYTYMARAGLLRAAWLSFVLVKAVSICGAFCLQSLLFAFLYAQQVRAQPLPNAASGCLLPAPAALRRALRAARASAAVRVCARSRACPQP